jgi:hypothetical protein
MRTQSLKFDSIVETIYSLPLEDRMEIKNLLEHNIADSRRNEIADNFIKSQEEHLAGQLKFSSKISVLKKML